MTNLWELQKECTLNNWILYSYVKNGKVVYECIDDAGKVIRRVK